MGFGGLVRLFSSSRQSDRDYLGWFVWDLVGKLFKMQGSRQPVKAYQGFGPIVHLLAQGSKFTPLSAGIHIWVQVER